MSPDAIDLVVKMTERDQYKRLTAKECLEHSWFEFGGSGNLLKVAITNLQNFGAEYECTDSI